MSGIRVHVSCSIAVKLTVVARDTGGHVIAGLTLSVLLFTDSYPSSSTFLFAGDCHFLTIVPVDFEFLPDLIGCRPTFEFKLTIIIFGCTSSNMVAEGIGGQASGDVARRRQATLLVPYISIYLISQYHVVWSYGRGKTN